MRKKRRRRPPRPPLVRAPLPSFEEILEAAERDYLEGRCVPMDRVLRGDPPPSAPGGSDG